MNSNEFRDFKAKMKAVSNIKFEKLIERQKSSDIDAHFIDMLARSEYFKDLFFEGFVEGANFMREKYGNR